MTNFPISSTQPATISVTNPNKVPIAVAMDLVVGDVRTLVTRGHVEGAIPAYATIQFPVTVPMPATEGTYPVNLWLDFDGRTAQYAIRDTIMVYTTKLPRVELTMDTRRVKVAGESLTVGYTLTNLNPTALALSNFVITVGSNSAPQSFTIPANGVQTGSVTIRLPATSEAEGYKWDVRARWDGLPTPLIFPSLSALMAPIFIGNLPTYGAVPGEVYQPGSQAPVSLMFQNNNPADTGLWIVNQYDIIISTPTFSKVYPQAGLPRILRPGVAYPSTFYLPVEDWGDQTFTGMAVFQWRQETIDTATIRTSRVPLTGTLRTTGVPPLLQPTVNVIGL